MNDFAPSPIERLARSREQLRHALGGTSSTSQTQAAPGPGRAWWHELRALPGAGIMVDAVQQWWTRHPLRATTLIAVDAAQAVVQPLARSHPLALVTGAFVVGALLAWRRPWGWNLKPALFAGLVPQLLIASLKAQAQQAPTPRKAE
jgi:hypothetical protein